MKFFLLLAFFMLANQFTGAQPYIKLADDYFVLVRAGKNDPILSKGIVNDRKNENEILSLITPFVSDSISEVRRSAYFLISEIGRRSLSQVVRHRSVAILVKGWRDTDSGINGLVGSTLQNLKPSDFDSKVKDSLRVLIQEIPPYYDKLVKLSGYLKMSDQTSVIQNQLETGAIKNKNYRWSAYLALCRMGNQQAVDYVMQRVRKLGVNDDVVYEIFPDLIYTVTLK